MLLEGISVIVAGGISFEVKGVISGGGVILSSRSRGPDNIGSAVGSGIMPSEIG